MGAKETFSNNQIETLLLNHDVTESLDQSVKRLKENAEFLIKNT